LIALIPTTKFRIRTDRQKPPFELRPTKNGSVLRSIQDDVTESSVDKDSTDPITTARTSRWKPKPPDSRWEKRLLLEDLKVGQELLGHVVQEYLEAKTGPKIYFECGVGRTNRSGDWSIVNGMLRLDRGKASVARKRAARFRKKDKVQLFVSRVQKECGRLEVCAKIDDVQKYVGEPKFSVTTLKEKQEVVGRVTKLYPYGAKIDIGANVQGLLHITKVASVMNRYIDKERGLISAGLEKGAKVRLVVDSIEKRRFSLDFTDDVKEEARREKSDKESDKKEPTTEQRQMTDEDSYSLSNDELEAWAEYANQDTLAEKQEKEEVDNSSVDDDDDDDHDEYDEEDDYDRYDEEMDIESSMGLDMY
jgi:predicted RNA-binding protein with RPS1 domain